jgi:tetratricopeptide (TPR) repeat protein
MRGSPPYLPFIEIVEQSITSPRSTLALREALGDTAPEIARIVPALRRIFPDLAPPTDLPAELAPRFLWNSVQEFIERASRKQPLLLVLEDLHWADESTILLTEYLAAQLPDMPALVIGTYRDIEVGIRHPLARSVNELSRRRLIDRISLTSLPLDGVAAMVEGLARQTAPERLVRMINSETEGNPFFVEEVFFHLAESGVLLDENGRVRSDLRIDEVDVPDSIRLVIEQRLERLSPSTRGVLLGAAVIGRAFVPELVGRVAQVDGDVLIDSLDEGERARLIVPLREDDRLGFSHELIRQTLLADTSTIRRERLHLRAADAIEASYAHDIEAHSADLAHHLSLAGRSSDRPRLIRYLKMAGERATEATAFEDAVANFTDALALVPADDADARGELLERLAMAQRSVGEWDTALETMNQALDLYESSGQTEAFGRLSWAFVYQLSWAGRFVEGVSVAGRALAALGQVPSSNLARLLSAAGWAMSLGGDYPSSNAMFDQARSLAEQIGDDRALADVLHMETIHHMGFAEFDRGVHSGLRAAEVFEAQGARWDLCSVRAFVIFEDGAFGRTEQADSLAQPTMAMARRLGHLGATFMLLADSARRDGVMAGDLPALDGIGKQMVEVCEQGGLPWLYVGHLYVGLAAHWQGDWDRAERELRVAVDLEPAAAYAGQSAALLAWHLAHQGRAKEVIDLFDAWKGGLPVSSQVNTIGAWNMLCGFVEALYLIGQGEGAAALAPLIAEALESVGDWITFDCRLTSTRAGIAAAAARRWDEAENHYLTALQRAEEISDRMEQADLRRLYGRLLLDRNADGDASQAQRLLAEAIERYRAMGMPKHVQVAQEMVAKASV